jgi:MFS family permease
VAALIGLAAWEAEGRIDGLARPEAGGAGLGLVPVIGGGIVLIAFLTENAAESWSALHIEQTLHGTPALGALGPATLALTMGFARLAGQGLAQRVDAIRLMLGGAAVSACGAVIVALATTPALAYAGFIVMGMGSSVIAPTAFTLVGALAQPAARARAIARATFLGYFGYFVGPPAFGLVAGNLGLRAAFGLAAVLLLAVWVLAPVMAKRR